MTQFIDLFMHDAQWFTWTIIVVVMVLTVLGLLLWLMEG